MKISETATKSIQGLISKHLGEHAAKVWPMYVEAIEAYNDRDFEKFNDMPEQIAVVLRDIEKSITFNRDMYNRDVKELINQNTVPVRQNTVDYPLEAFLYRDFFGSCHNSFNNFSAEEIEKMTGEEIWNSNAYYSYL